MIRPSDGQREGLPMNPAAHLQRVAQAGREMGLRVAFYRSGLPVTLNGLALRIDPRTRRSFVPEYEPRVAAFLQSRIRPGAEIWNVGANVGVYALQAANWVGPSGRVLAFEPNPAAARLLMRNVRLNGLQGRVEIVPSAVGETCGEATLYVAGVDGMSRLSAANPLLGWTRPLLV